MKKIRLIAKIDIKGPNVIKGIRMEGLRIVGEPATMSKKYFYSGIDEIILIDSVASLYGRNTLAEMISDVSKEILVPLVVGGGLRSIEDCHKILAAGADKLAINTHAVKFPSFITQAALAFGSQCIVLSVHAKREKDGIWMAYCENGRQPANMDVLTWVKKAVDLGAGEILITSIDNDGTMSGFDVPLYREISSKLNVPIIASGGAGTVKHIIDCVESTRVYAVSLGAMLHFNINTISNIKNDLQNNGIKVRNV